MKRILFLIIFIASCSTSKDNVRVEHGEHGEYCYYDDGDKLFMSLRLHPDGKYEFYEPWEGVTHLEKYTGEIKVNNDTLLFQPKHKANLEIRELGNREDDSTHIYCYYGSYELVDTHSLYRIVNGNKNILDDYSFINSGVIRIKVEDDMFLEMMFATSSYGIEYQNKPILKLEKGKNYHIWHAEGEEDHNLEGRKFYKLNDSIYNLRIPINEKEGDYLDIPLQRCRDK